MFLLLTFLTAVYQKYLFPDLAITSTIILLSIPTTSILVLVLSHFYYRSHLLTRCLSSSSARTLSQIFCNTDTRRFSHHYSDQGLSPSEGLVVYYSSGHQPFRPHRPLVVSGPLVDGHCTRASGNLLGRDPLLPSPFSLS